MTLTIGATAFDRYDGDILLPRRTTSRFASPVQPYAGIQVLPEYAPPFTLECIRYTAEGSLSYEREVIERSIGQVLPVVDDGEMYEMLPWRVVFAILDAAVTSTVVPLAMGSRYDIPFVLRPAGIIQATITMQAVPIAY